MTEIPLISGARNAHQTFSMSLGGKLLDFTLNYITTEGPAWSLDVRESGTLLLSGVMLEPDGVIASHAVGDFHFVGDDVTLDNLGTGNKLMWTPRDE